MTTAKEQPPPLRIAVIGAGTIGTSVAYACLRAGHSVVLVDRADKDWAGVRTALQRHQRLTRLIGSDQPPVDIGQIRCSADLADVSDAQLIVENVTEDWAIKREVYAALHAHVRPGAVLAANTSAISIDLLADEAPDPAQVVGLHFMNPVAAVGTVEVVRGPRTAAETLETVTAFLTGMGKRGVVVEDAPGFVINRILMVMVNQAAQLVDEGVATPAQIDQLFKGCLGHAMGPLRTADLIGLDTIVNTLRVLQDARGDSQFAPAAGLVGRVERHELGIKGGRGFYEYDTE